MFHVGESRTKTRSLLKPGIRREKRNTDLFKSGTRKGKAGLTAATAVSRVEQGVSSRPPRRLADRGLATAAHNAQLAARQAQIAERNDERGRREFFLGPVGQARTAFERGDPLFQLLIDVESQNKHPTVVAIVDGSRKTTRDPNEILNAVANEGWRIVTASFVARDELLESRDDRRNFKVDPSAPRITTGCYVFERASRLGVRHNGSQPLSS